MGEATERSGLVLDDLIDSGVLMRSQIQGIYARSACFETIAEALEQRITAAGADDGAEVLRFPPVMPRRVLSQNGYFIGFPHLAGCVHSFVGSPDDHRALLYNLMCDEPTDSAFQSTGIVLTPAACYPVYPLIAGRGALPAGGVLVDVESYCFRHEPSDDPARMQSFRMREYVRIGAPEQVIAFREDWLRRARGFVDALGLDGRIELAHDPFFGSGRETLGAEQISKALKFEMLIPSSSVEQPRACMSFNYHETHFAAAWSLRQTDGTLAHTACVGFGIERLVLALLAAHGMNPDDWPPSIRRALWPRA